MNMSRNNLRNITVALIVLLLGMVGPAFGTPAIYWWHMELGVPRSTCANRAGAAIASEIVVDKIDKGPNGASAWNKDTRMVIYCTAKGSTKTEVVIFVAGDQGKGRQTSETMQQLRDAMKSGLLE
jgi:hypothetical protein